MLPCLRGLMNEATRTLSSLRLESQITLAIDTGGKESACFTPPFTNHLSKLALVR